MAADADPSSSSRVTGSSNFDKNDISSNVQTYWHAAYKVSDIPSPREDLKFDGAKPLSELKRLSLLNGNMTAEEESLLRSFLMDRVVNSFCEGEFESLVEPIGINNPIENTPTQLYCKAVYCNESKELIYIICFVTATKSGLELFQNDLNKSSSRLVYHLNKYVDTGNTDDYLKEVDDWWVSNVNFVKECLQTFDYNLATLICAGFCGDTVIFSEGVPANIKKNVERLLHCCNLSMLFAESKTAAEVNSPASLKDLVPLENPEKILVQIDENSTINVMPTKPSTFCNDCIRQLKVNQNLGPIQMRQMIENFKLKSIQDMNTFKRLLTQAEVDYYACFRTYLFLVTSGNGLVLMRNSRLQHSMENTQKQQAVLDTLESFIKNREGFGTFDTKERKEQLTNKMGQLRFN